MLGPEPGTVLGNVSNDSIALKKAHISVNRVLWSSAPISFGRAPELREGLEGLEQVGDAL